MISDLAIIIFIGQNFVKTNHLKAGGHVRRGSDPTALISAKSCANTSSGTQSSVVQGGSNVSKTRLNPSATAVAAVAAAGSSGPLDQQHPLPLVKGKLKKFYKSMYILKNI